MFPFAKVLEEHWETIYAEFQNLGAHQLDDWHQKDLYGDGWKVFGLYSFPEGEKLNEELCPFTTRLIEEHIPHHGACGFSILYPGTEIKPHVGYEGNFLRCHLGLKIPEDCAIEVNGIERSWEEGKVMVFDDTYEHSAWNLSDEIRIILLIDFIKKQ